MGQKHDHGHDHHLVGAAGRLPSAKAPWEPRSKLLCGLVYIFGVITLQDPLLVAAALLFAIIFVLAGGLTPLQLSKKLLLLAPLLALMSIPLLFGAGLPPSPDRVNLTLLIVLKALTAMTFTLFVFTNQPIENMLEALEHLRVPGVVATVIYLAYRYGFLIFYEAQTMTRALKARLFQPQLSRRSLPIYGELAGGLFIKALNRSETVYRAMASRGFQSRMPVSPPRNLRRGDFARAAIPIIFILGLIAFGQVVY